MTMTVVTVGAGKEDTTLRSNEIRTTTGETFRASFMLAMRAIGVETAHGVIVRRQ